MAATEVLLNRLPQGPVVILGATGTGKSNLAIRLAQRFKGEVISADSMQVYRDLDILTNKVTLEEMRGVPHHMISIVEPHAYFDVTSFRNQALPIVEKVMAEGKIPFIVGGTNYYIESLLWKILLDKKEANRSHDTDIGSAVKRRKTAPSPAEIDTEPEYNEILNMFLIKGGIVEEEDILDYSSPQLYAALQRVDSERANKFHPNDRRKILRSLQVRYQTGRKHSDILLQQFEARGEGQDGSTSQTSMTHLGGPLRFPDSICLWIQAEKPILNERINQRVDAMVSKGLRQELETFILKLRQSDSELDFTRGILQSIGFKEFNAYLQLTQNERTTQAGEKLFNEGIELLKTATRQYASRQLKWINQRFLQPNRREVPPVYWLNGTYTDTENWEKLVSMPSLTIVESYLSRNSDHPSLVKHLVPFKVEDEDDLIARTCHTCDRVLIGTVQWKEHITGNRHKKVLRRQSKSANSTVTLQSK